MSSTIGTCSRAILRASLINPSPKQTPLVVSPPPSGRMGVVNGWRISATKRDGSSSYLDMWKKAVERERKTAIGESGDEEENVDVEKKSEEFKKILEASKEDRDRIQRMQVIDRAAAAIAAARAILKEKVPSSVGDNGGLDGGDKIPYQQQQQHQEPETENGSIFVAQSESSEKGVPGPDFWTWTPPSNSETQLDGISNLQGASKSSVYPTVDSKSDGISNLQRASKSSVYPTVTNPTALKERSMDFISIPFESNLSDKFDNPSLPPLQSAMQVEKSEVSEQEQEISVLFMQHAAEIAHALNESVVPESLSSGVNQDGSRWWKETGIEQRPDGVICRWTMARGVSVDQSVEWQEKFWEAADELGYKELGSEKSGRDATGNVWREFWRESMREDNGLLELEKTADKWGKNGKGEEWQEKWREHYGSGGEAEKWAHKWCSIDPTTQLDAGHAHVWNERWGEKYDGHGGSIKYTDKWAERCEGDGWSKWGDKWDENFDPSGRGVKQGETWWEGKYGERWNRTWGEGHNGSGWVHKYGKSSSGEHWDTHVQQETWYEKFPHYGLYHCFENSVPLRAVKKPSEAPLSSNELHSSHDFL